QTIGKLAVRRWDEADIVTSRGRAGKSELERFEAARQATPQGPQSAATDRSLLDNRRSAWFHERAGARALRTRPRGHPPEDAHRLGHDLGTALGHHGIAPGKVADRLAHAGRPELRADCGPCCR